MHILITGSSGHLGMALSIVLANSPHQVTGIDLQPSKYTHHIGSIADKDFVQKYGYPSKVVNLVKKPLIPTLKNYDKLKLLN